MAKRLTDKERKVRVLIDRLAKNFEARAENEGLGREDLYAKMALEVGVSDRMLRYYVNRSIYPRTQSVVAAVERYLERVDA